VALVQAAAADQRENKAGLQYRLWPPGAADFRDMKSKYTEQLGRLNARLAVREQNQDVPDLLDAGIDNLLKLDYIYLGGGIDKKREVIGSMYPEKLTFDKRGPCNHIRSGRGFQKRKKRTKWRLFHLACCEVAGGFEPPWKVLQTHAYPFGHATFDEANICGF
jgi:hypothetical protein